MKKFLTILLLLATMFPFAAKADQLTVCDGTNTNGYVPVYGFYADAYLRAQMVYPASMLADMNGTTISGMKFYATQSSVNWGATFQVYMAEYPSTTISSFINPTTATTVYTGTLAIAGGEMVVTLDQQFNYAGGNLLIGFDQTTTGTYATSTWKGQNTDGASVQGYSYSSVAGISPAPRNFLPKVTFDYYVPSLEVGPTDLGTRPNGAWMEPVTVEVGGGVYNVTAMDIDNDYFTFEGPAAPFTTPASFTATTGDAAATGLVEGTLTFMYNDGKAVKQFNMKATAYDPTAGDVVETATVVSNPVGYTNTPTGIYHNYNLPGEASDGADAVYKLTFASDVMLDANVGDAAGGKVALYAEDFNGEAGPMATNAYNGPEIGPGPRNIWFSYPYTGTNTFYGSSTSGMIFGYEISAEVIAANGLAGLTLTEVESAACETYPYDLLIMTGVSGPENLVYYQPMGTAAEGGYFFNLPLSEPYVLGEENTWIMFMTDSPYSAYCGKTPVDADNAKIWYSQDLASWYTSTTYTPMIDCHFMELPTGREVSMNLADMTVKADYAGGTMAEATAAVNGTSKAAAFNARKSNTRETLTYGFEDGTLQGWTNIDADGDGLVWMDCMDYGCYAVDYAHTGSHSVVSASYDMCGNYGYVAFDANNYLVSPQKFNIVEGSKLSFWYDDAEVMYGCPDYFEVCVSTAGNTSASDFTAVWNNGPVKSNGAKDGRGTRSYGTWRQVEVDLSAYAGQEVYIAFHHQQYDGYDLWIDDVELKVNEPAPGMFVPAGTYYLVAQATEAFTTNISTAAAPAPEQAVVLYPTDGTMNVEAPVLAEWILGNYTTEMQVLVGSQYPPQTALIDWTSELVESAFLTNLLPNTTYFMQVNVRNAAGTTMGEVIGFTTVIEAPVELEVAAENLYPGDAAMLSWTANRSFRGYNVYVDGEKWNSEVIEDEEYAVEGLAYGSHSLNVTALYDEGESDFSNTVYVAMTGFGHVAGIVYEQDGTTPIADATVKFIGTDSFDIEQTFAFTTAEDGTFAGDVIEGVYTPVAMKDGYQDTPLDEIFVSYDETVDGLTFVVREFFAAPGTVVAEELENNNVNVYWDWNPAALVEDFEHDGEMPEGWNQVGSYGWEITTNAPYEGTYCIKSSNAGISSSTGAIEVTVDVPYEAKMSFYVKPSCESNYDKFYFYIDGVEKFNTSGAGSWTKKEYNVSAGTHTYKWAYTKDSSVNSNDDCIYVDYVTLFEKVQPEPPFAGGWIQYDDGTYASSVGTGSAGSNVYWAVCWPNASAYNGLSMTKAALYDAYAGAYTVNIYEGGTDAPQTLIGTTTINGTGSSTMVEGTFSTPISIDGTKPLWIVGVCNQLEYPMAGCSYVGDPNSDLLSLDGATWEHAADYSLSYSWMLRGYLQSAKGDMVVLDAAERAPQNIVRPELTFDYGTPSTGTFMAKVAETPVYVGVGSNYTRGEANNTRSFQSYVVYRKNVLTDEVLPLTSTLDTTYVDATWPTLPAGVYQWGVSATYAGNRGDRAGRSELTVNDGTDYCQYIPVHGYYCDAEQENQFILPASQLAEMSGSTISSMTFYLSTVAPNAWNCPFEVRLMETAATTLDAMASVSGATLVYTGTPSGTSSPMTITFDTPFTYNGGNLLVDFANTTSGNYSDAYFYGVNTTTNTAYFKYYDAWNGYWSEFPWMFLPKVTFTYEGGTPVPPIGNEEVTFSFDNDFEGWTVIDNDGDGHVWYHSSEAANHGTMAVTSHSGAGHVMGESYCNATYAALTPDDYMVAPEKYNLNGESQITFYVCAQDENYAAEHFGVAISTTGNTSAADFTTINEWTLTAKTGFKGPRATDGSREGAWYQYTCDLSAYAGQEAWIAIRHFNCSDQFLMCLDDVTITYGGATPPAPVGDGESEITWSNTLEKGMVVAVDVKVVCNNNQSAEGTTVTFTNMVENIVIEGAANAAGIVSFPEFRSGYYTMEIAKAGYATVAEEIEIFEDMTIERTLNEIIAPAEGLFASATGWVMWENIGGDVPPTPQGDTEFTEGFEGGLNGWNVLDVNTGEGTWVHSDDNVQGQIYTSVAHTGTGFAVCYSFIDNVGAVSTDSYMYTPQKYQIVNGSTLSFWADNANDSYPENFSVCIATADNPQDADFTEVWSGGAKGGNAEKAAVRHSANRYNNWRHHTIDLSAYAGQEVYIAFHDVNYDMYEIWIDDVELTTGSKDRSALHSIVMLDGVIAGQATGNWFQLDTDNLVEGQEYEVSVASVYATGMSEWRTTTFTYWSCENYKPGVKNLAGEAEGNDVTLTWTLPGGGGEGDEFSFSFDSDLEGWTNIDADGDGHMWYHSNEAANHSTMAVTSHSGAGHVMGESYCNATWAALTPNDFFVTPQQYNIGASSRLSFWACAQDENYAAEHFGVAISTTGNTSAADFTTIAEWTLTAKNGGPKGPRATDGSREGAWYEYTCDLSEYAGQAAWIAIRHFNCSDQFLMCLDDISMSNADGKKGNSNRAMWDLVASFSCTSAGQQAVATDGEFIYTASWQATPTGGYTFYKYDLEGTFIEGFDISGATGIRDLTFDGEYFYGSSGASQLFILDLANKTKIGQINCSGATSRHCTYDPVRDAFWVGNWSDLALYDRSGAMIQNGPSPSSAYGSGYFQDEDGTEHLYLFCQPNSDALVYDYNITTGQLTGPVMDFSQTPGFNAGISGGSFVGQYNGKICWFGNAQQDPNLVGIYELAEGETPIEGDFLGAMIFRDGELITPEPLMAQQLVDENVAEGEHEYMARLAFGNAEFGVLDTMWYAMSCPIFATVNVEIECTPVNNLAADYEFDAEGNCTVELTWACANASAESFKVYRDGVFIGETADMVYTDDRTNNPGSYTYGVVAVYEYCESEMVTVDVTITSVEENDVVEGIYPNPTTGKLYIKAAAMQQITVANALGQVMMNETVSGDETMIDMSAFEAGVYMVRVATENGTTVKRISVVK